MTSTEFRLNSQSLDDYIYKQSKETNEYDQEIFGERCASGFRKVCLLGRGDKSMVWLAQSRETKSKVALKQFTKDKDGRYDVSCDNEIAFSKVLFPAAASFGLDEMEQPAPIDFKKQPVLASISRLLYVLEEENDIWLAYEKGEQTLSSLLFKFEQQDDDTYSLTHGKFYQLLNET